MTEITTIGLDLAKSVFQVHAIDATGTVVIRRQIRRAQMMLFFSRLAPVPDWHGSLRWGALLGA